MKKIIAALAAALMLSGCFSSATVTNAWTSNCYGVAAKRANVIITANTDAGSWRVLSGTGLWNGVSTYFINSGSNQSLQSPIVPSNGGSGTLTLIDRDGFQKQLTANVPPC